MIRKNTNQNKGQVGIGTLIVFIAIVLVAAVAASVIIEVSGLLQDRAEQTSTETISEVGDQLVVISSFGSVNNSTDTKNVTQITELRLNVRRSAGAEIVNLDAVTIDFDSPSEQFFLLSRNSTALEPTDFESNSRGFPIRDSTVDAAVDVGLFNTSALVDQSGGLAAPPRSVNSRLDRGEIAINLQTRGNNTEPIGDSAAPVAQTKQPAALLEDQRVQLTLSTGAGATTITTLNIPAVLTDEIVRLDR